LKYEKKAQIPDRSVLNHPLCEETGGSCDDNDDDDNDNDNNNNKIIIIIIIT